eukprot:4757169-Pyramimonas_sp.AAC.1
MARTLGLSRRVCLSAWLSTGFDRVPWRKRWHTSILLSTLAVEMKDMRLQTGSSSHAWMKDASCQNHGCKSILCKSISWRLKSCR